MLRLSPLLALLTFASLAFAASSNSTATDCPSCDATACDKRSIWSLLASCGVTLLICVWHAVHPGLPLPHWKWYHVLTARICCMLVTFVAPEFTISCAVSEWTEVKQVTERARARGYQWWTMTHSHFVLNGGFVLHDSKGRREVLKTEEILDLLDAGSILNPDITEADIKDRSSSDGLAKAILVAQLSWFMIQVIVRLLNHLAVTLIELDTVCMALLTFPLIICWWKKPFCATRPHIFYKSDTDTRDNPETSTKDNDSEKLLPGAKEVLSITTTRNSGDILYLKGSDDNNPVLSLLFTWMVLGGLHLIAWNYEFPTTPEKIIWRVASLLLAVSPIFLGMGWVVAAATDHDGIGHTLTIIFAIIAITSRLLLVGLMLASLRSLPPTAYQIIPWTTYIPHL